MPELIYESAETVPAALKDIAAEKDGKWVANVVPKAELDDFRNRNIEISRDRDRLTSLTGRFTTDLGFDPEKVDDFVTEVNDLRTIKQQVDDGKLVKDTSLASAIESKTAEMRRNFEAEKGGLTNQVKSLTGENETLKHGLNRAVIDKEVMLAVTQPDSGALPNATLQIMREAYDTFKVEDGKLIAKDKDNNIIYGGDGATPLTPKEWLAKLSESMPFYFKQAQGGGGNGGLGGGGSTLTEAQLATMSPEEQMNYGRKHGMNR